MIYGSKKLNQRMKKKQIKKAKDLNKKYSKTGKTRLEKKADSLRVAKNKYTEGV